MIDRNVKALAKSLATRLKPRPPLPGTEYADKYYYICSRTEGRQKWFTRPYQRDWMLATTDPMVQCIVCQKPSRVGWSEYVKFVIQYFCHWRPSKIMIVQPTDEEVKKYSDEELDRGLFDPAHGAPCLNGALGTSKSRTSLRNNYNYKQGRNGFLIDLRHAGSPGSARRVNRPVICLEEPAAYAQLSEGDTIQLFLQRAGTAVDPFFTIGGTPVHPGDYMDQCFKMGDQQFRYYPCPHCGGYQELMTRDAWQRFIKEGEDAGKLKCEHCNLLIEYKHLRKMDEAGGWACPIGKNIDRTNQILDDEGNPIWRSQQVGPGMSYHRAASWTELARRWRNAALKLRQGDPDPMQTFHNTDMGIPWEPAFTSQITAEGLAKRALDVTAGNNYPPDGAAWEAPLGVLAVFVGVDVQGGGGTRGEGLRIQVWGFGRGEESWHLAEFSIDGDPSQQETLDRLDAVVSQAIWHRQDAARLTMHFGMIDEGGLSTESVRRWCAKRLGKWAPVRGMPQIDAPLLGQGQAAEYTAKNKKANRLGKDVMYYPVGYKRSVNHLLAQLNVKTPGPGYIHLGRACSEQTMSELFPWKLREIKRGSGVYTWELPGGCRDEAGDGRRYAYAAMQHYSRRWGRMDAMWAELERQAMATISNTPERRPSLLDDLHFA